MPKLSPKEMQAAIEQFKSQFTPGFFHGSPSPNIKEFDPTKSAKDPMYITPKATFVTRDPEFAESFLSMNNSGKIKSGSTMYPVSVKLGQHWNPNTPEGRALVQEFIEKHPKRVNLEKGLKRGDWTAVENSDFLTFLKDTGHDTFHVMEGGIPNVGVLKPENIRGKFAEYNPEEAANPDFMKADGGAVEGYADGKSVLPNVNVETRNMPNMTGMPGVGYMQTPQGAMARLQMEKELEEARIRAGVSGMAMAIPGQQGVKTMPGQMDIGANVPVGPGRLDVSANRSINPIPGRGHMQGVNARYTIPFANGGAVEGYAPGGKVGALESLVKPVVNRINMHFKDVTQRVPELQESAQKLMSGEGSREAHEALVNTHKPVLPFEFVPKPATKQEAIGALTEDKKAKYGIPSQTLEAGHPVGLRLDIPAYSNHGVWVPTVHEQKSGFGAGTSIGHESVASVLNPAFGMSEQAALSIASGKPKGTIATIKGNWNPIDEQEAVARAQEYLSHPEWRQVGMDPERHSYFYDRATMEPITHGEEALQIGPLVLVKKPIYGKKEDFKFKQGGKAKKKKK